MAIWIILIAGAYLLGSFPTSYLVAKSRGIDLRKHGTKQVGGGNLWRTTSRKLGLMVGIFDFFKGMLMVWITHLLGLDTFPQLVVGLAAIIGHNWPVFLRFHGGRGIATLLGIVIILPVLNDISPWPSAIAVGIVVVVTLIIRTTPLPVFFSAVSLPVTTWIFHGETAVILAFLAIFLVIVIKRLTAQPSTQAASISKSRLFSNRLLFDRDIRDRKAWISHKAIAPEELLDE
jgi:glycerol-3-phosphate acyltransferase PlsY